MVEKKKLIHEPYNKFKGFMRENGIIYSHIAELLGVTPTTVSQKVNGQSDFTVSEAELIMRTSKFFCPECCVYDNKGR